MIYFSIVNLPLSTLQANTWGQTKRYNKISTKNKCMPRIT